MFGSFVKKCLKQEDTILFAGNLLGVPVLLAQIIELHAGRNLKQTLCTN